MMQPPNFNRIGQLLDQAQPLEMAIMPFRAFVLVAQLQLALRHPDNQGSSAEIARDIATRLQTLLGQIDPAIAEALEQGWNPEFDVTRAEFEELMEGDRHA